MYLIKASLSTVTFILAFLSVSNAFQPVHNAVKSTSSFQQKTMPVDSASSSSTSLFQAKKVPSTVIKTKGKKTLKSKKEPEKEKQNGLSLVLTYMTPWRNPNSIFVYMFGLLYALGKYSESH